MNRDVCEHFNPADLPCAKCEEKRKSEALFLADELEIPLGTVIQSEVNRRAAAELRRLHEAHDWQYRMAGERLHRVEKLEAQRDALLEALKTVEWHGQGSCWIVDADKIAAAIKAAEENT